MASQHTEFDEFVDTIAALRAPDGCPWDREQTHASIARNMIEEAYEAVDTIESNDIEHLREELGDVLLQVVLQSQIAADAGEFTIDDVCRDINDKIIRRHPHVFGDTKKGSVDQVLDLWDNIKLSEKESEDAEAAEIGEARKSLMDDVPRSFPALMQAQKISRKAVSAGFEWETIDEVWNQVYEEIAELKEAFAAAPKTEKGKAAEIEEVEMEFGDVLFSLVNVARKMGVDAENALRTSCNKFRSRWGFIEGAAWSQDRKVEDLSVEEMEALWTEAKKLEE